MSIYVITSNYFPQGYFGTYSSVKRARIAFEHFLAEDEDIVSFEDVGNYSYQFTTKNGATFGAEIYWDLLDAEFEERIVKEDE